MSIARRHFLIFIARKISKKDLRLYNFKWITNFKWSIVWSKEELNMSRRGENIHKRKDKRWEGRYIKGYDSITGKALYASVYGKTYMDVKQKMLEINRIGIDNSVSKTERKRTFREVLYLWLENRRVKLKSQTYSKYYNMIELHIIQELGCIPICELTAMQINQFLLKKRSVGKIGSEGGLSASSVQTISFIISSAIRFGIQQGYCTALKGEVLKIPKKKNELEIMSLQQQNEFMLWLLNDIDSRRIGVILALYAGLRIGEVCGLAWDDINFETKTLHIHHTLERIRVIDCDEDSNKTKLQLCETKSLSSNRVIPLSEALADLLKKCRLISVGRFVVTGNTYEFIDPRTFQYWYTKLLSDYGMPHFNYHSLRHTFATRCIESGMDVKTLSELLGHSSVNITLNTYVHSSMNHKRTQLTNMHSFCGQNCGQQ